MADNPEKPNIRKEHCFEGIWYGNLILDSSIERMRTLDVRPDDVYIISYPKSGTHWLMEIVGLILTDGYPDKIDRRLNSACAEMIVMPQALPRTRAEEEKKPADMTPYLDVIEKGESPRVISTHLRMGRMPQDMLKKAKALYVARNPKDTVRSWFDFKSSPPFQSHLWEESLEQFKTGRIQYGPWFEHVKEFWEKRDDPNLLFLVYEDMLRDPAKYIQQIAEHLGRPLSESALQRAVEQSQLKSMKATYAKGHGGSESIFLNQAICGKWKQRFTVTQNEAFDEWYNNKVAGTDLKFTFE